MGSLITVTFNLFSVMSTAHTQNSGVTDESVKQDKEAISQKPATLTYSCLPLGSILEYKLDRLWS